MCGRGLERIKEGFMNERKGVEDCGKSSCVVG